VSGKGQNTLTFERNPILEVRVEKYFEMSCFSLEVFGVKLWMQKAGHRRKTFYYDLAGSGSGGWWRRGGAEQ
jgi:hypothetical protein